MTILRMQKGNSVDWKRVRGMLAVERKRLFDGFQADPTNTRLAGEIMRLDDQILDCGKRDQLLDHEQAA